MKNNTFLARPYARAIFELARESNTFQAWQDQLAVWFEVIKNPDVLHVLRDPRLTPEQKVEIVEAVTPQEVGEDQKHFLHLVAKYGRLSLMGEIDRLYNQYKSAFEKVVDVHLTTAAPIDEKMQSKFKQALMKRLEKEINLSCDTNPDIMGGAIIRAGDHVIDGSVRSRLERLVETLIA